MYNEDDLIRLKSVKAKIDTIYEIVKRHGGIVNALQDIEGQPAILMLLVAISEQFAKLQKTGSKILENFNDEDIKGLSSVRNYIAHDYDGVNLNIIENDLRMNMPKILEAIGKIV